MERVKQLGYLTIGVTNLDEGIDFYSRVARLHLTERRGRTAFMTGGREHHWIRMEEGSGAGVRRMSLEALDEAALEGVRADLRSGGIDVTEGGDIKDDKVQRWLRFADPAGAEVELFLGMEQRPVDPPSPGVAIEKFLHAGWEMPNYDATYDFYTRILGFRPSDFIGNAVSFLHCGDRFHHSLALIRSSAAAPKFNHFCVQVESLDDVMRFRHNALRHGARLRDDLLRHAPSGSIGVYVSDAARELAVEYCYDHPRVAEDHEPRILPMAAETVDVWRSELPDLLSDATAPTSRAPRTVDERGTNSDPSGTEYLSPAFDVIGAER